MSKRQANKENAAIEGKRVASSEKIKTSIGELNDFKHKISHKETECIWIDIHSMMTMNWFN